MKTLENLACNAAVGLDSYLLRKARTEDYGKIEELTDYLNKAYEKRDLKTGYLSKDITINLTIWFSLDKPHISIIKIAEKTKEIAEELSDHAKLNQEKIKSLRKFCLNLSKEAHNLSL